MYLYRVVYFLFFLSVSGTAFGQIYGSTDSDGVPTFSDQPSADSHEVNIQETNVGDSLDVPKNTSVSVPTPPPLPEETSKPTPVSVEVQEDDNDGDFLDENRREKRRDHRADDPERRDSRGTSHR
jgi:hypothetical protein